MSDWYGLPAPLYTPNGRINLYCLHVLFAKTATLAAEGTQGNDSSEGQASAGLWGGAFLVAAENGVARAKVKRLYSIVNVPQTGVVATKSGLDGMLRCYTEKTKEVFGVFGIDLEEAGHQEILPCSNKRLPSIGVGLVDRSRRVEFVKLLFVRNQAEWEISIVHDAVRNTKQVRQILNKRLKDKTETFISRPVIQDILTIRETLRPCLDSEYLDKTNAIFSELRNGFIQRRLRPEFVGELERGGFFHDFVFICEWTLRRYYEPEHLNIRKIEEWPVEKINWVPYELARKAGGALAGRVRGFRDEIEQRKQYFLANRA